MTSLWKSLPLAAAALVAIPAAASAAERSAANEPVKLADHELDQVVAGDGSLLDLPLNLNLTLKNITVTVNVSNVPINAGVALQANILGTAAQTASVTALQQVTQLQTLPGF